MLAEELWMVLIGTVITSVGARDPDKFAAIVGYFAWYVYPCSFHFMTFLPNVLTNLLIFVAYAMFNPLRCITRRVGMRRQKTADITLEVFGLVIPHETMPLFGHSECVNSSSLTTRFLISPLNS
jgi:hypothetical protein